MFLGGEKYDFHLLLKKLEGGTDKLSALARNTQRLRTLQINSFLCLDSTAHLPSSLAKLAETLKLNKNYPYSIFKQSSIFKNKTSEMEKTTLMEKLNCKGFYPYSAFETVEALQKQKVLPKPEKFYNILTQENIANEDYKKALDVWESFSCNSMVDYLELYLKTDVSNFLLQNLNHKILIAFIFAGFFTR